MLKTFIHKGCDSFLFFVFFCTSLFLTTTYDPNPLNVEEGEGWTGGAWDPEWGVSSAPREERSEHPGESGDPLHIPAAPLLCRVVQGKASGR